MGNRLRGTDPGAPLSVSRAVAVFAASGALTFLLIIAGLAALMSRTGHDEAVSDAARLTEAYGLGVVQPEIENALLSLDPAARGRFQAELARRLEGSEFSRVKLWTQDGVVLASDEALLVGRRFELNDEAQQVLADGETIAEVSAADHDENQLDGISGTMLEVYQRLRAPDGTPVLFEAYVPYTAVQAQGHQLWWSFTPLVVLGLLLMWLLQLPLAWSMAGQLRAGQQERERLLRRAIEVSDAERRTIAADLHNGVVQTLAGTAFSLGAVQHRLPADTDPEVRQEIGEAAESSRAAIRELRAMLVNLYPASLRSSGLDLALHDLAAPLEARGIATDVSTDLADRPPTEVEALLYRSAQEALRNVVKHAEATSVTVRATGDAETWRLVVADDGRGVPTPVPAAVAPSQGERMGLRLLGELAADVDGSLRIEPGDEGGTVVTVEVPRTLVGAGAR